jgi:hypothetical protein
MSTPLSHYPASNTDAVVNISALDTPATTYRPPQPYIAGGSIEIEDIHCGYDAAPTGGIIKIESPVGTIIYQEPVTSEGLAPLQIGKTGFTCPQGKAARITLTAGGGGVTGYLNVFPRGT